MDVYRLEECSNIAHVSILVEKKKKDEVVVTKNRKKLLDREEGKLKNSNRELSMVKMKSMFAIGIAFTAMLSIFSTLYVTKSLHMRVVPC